MGVRAWQEASLLLESVQAGGLLGVGRRHQGGGKCHSRSPLQFRQEQEELGNMLGLQSVSPFLSSSINSSFGHPCRDGVTKTRPLQ